ncbi:TPA: hypothetical protein EYN98_20115 [Candidatus Poribacteria bacterium]|nr:hypothetical protein [Candidatus Poribacteria bacterium]
MQHPKTNQQARLNFQQEIKAYQQAGNPIVYLDESGFAQDCHAGRRVNVMGALRGLTFLTVALFDGHVNSDVFYAWLIQEL